MIKPMDRASIAAARRFIKAKGWKIDGKEVVVTGQEERIPITQFCRDYADRIAAYDKIRMERHKKAVKAGQVIDAK